MQLKSLEINGFKSFAKKSNLLFNSSITSIVGPNGSGKSNVAESFRFVLGEQSIKSLRGKKGEDLIFNGGKDTPRANRASVKLVFDNKSRLFNMDFDEIVVERVVHRDGVNEYFINGSQVRLKDIAEMLSHANIGSSGHHIISQGEADRLLSSSIQERREMIEDALGLKIYQYKKDESEKKLEKTAIHMKEVESLRREIAPHIKFLKKQVEKIEKAAALRIDLSAQYREYFSRESYYLKNEKNRLTQSAEGPKLELRNLEIELAEHKKTIDLTSDSVSGGHGGAKNNQSSLLSLESLIHGTRGRKDALTRDLGRLEGEMAYIKRSIEKKAREVAEAKNRMNSNDGGISADDRQIYLSQVESLAKEIDGHLNIVLHSEDLSAVRKSAGEIKRAVLDFIYHHKNSRRVTEIISGERNSSNSGSDGGSGSDNNENNEDSDEQGLISIAGKIAEIETNLQSIDNEEKEHQAKYQELKLKIDKEKEKNVESEKAILRIMSKQNELHGILNALRSEEERLRIEESDYEREFQEAGMMIGRDAINFPDFTDPAGTSESRSVQIDRRRAIEKSKIRLEEMGGGGGDDVMKEYRDAEERDRFLSREIEDLVRSSEALQGLIKEMTKKLDEMFRDGIKKINTEFDRFFKLMFGGGEARLDVVREEKKKRRKSIDGDELADSIGLDVTLNSAIDSDDDEESREGIDIHVALPHKRTKGLMMLSGGERALTSIALLFAMSQVNPPPFIILDETDAALDEANSRKYGDMIEALSKHSQLILITHNRETMSRAGVIYGVTMASEGCSKLLSIAFDEAVAVAK